MTKKPVLIWVISIFFLITALFSIVATTCIYFDVIPIVPQSQDKVKQIPLIALVLSIAVSFVEIIGSISLLHLRKSAFSYFVAGLILCIADALFAFLVDGEWKHGIGIFARLLIPASVCIYIRVLILRGLLI
ncbi:hypothetical protein [uncultured Propionivibrio sp.]|uniref:hypothetical protein n=1 Tax=uncultured Propionivibrio sp. TaxID=426737 RepID=UPI003748A5E7